LYRVFSKYEKPDDFPACKCCISEEAKVVLLSRKLEDLNESELSEYAADVFLTVGTLRDFRYFLPRILELSVGEAFLWPYPQIVLRKLRLAGWAEWPEDERTAVLEVLQDKFEALILSSNAHGQDINQWLCAIGQFVDDLNPYLDQILQADDERLSEIVEWNLSAFTKGELGSSFWEPGSTNERRFLAWLNQQPRIKAILSDRYGMQL